MSLRTRLVVSSTLLLVVAIVAVGLIAVRSVEATLLAQKDEALSLITGRVAALFPRPGDTLGGQVILRSENAAVLVDRDGEVVSSLQSGFQDDPDPLPDVSAVTATDIPIFVPAVDGSLNYRAVAVPVARGPMEGAMLVWALPLDDVEEATSSMVRTMVLAGTMVLVAGGLGTWWTVKRATRPVEQMVDTAEGIAAGDLSRRVPALAPGTELGRLGASLNEMLAHIEESVKTEREARERLRRFVADASHELRTPLATISGYTELHSKGGIGPEEEDKAWSRVQREAGRMRHLVEDLLMLTRLGQTQVLDVARVDLARLARDAADDHSVVDPDRSVSVSAPDSVIVSGDEQRLHQVVSNLLSNVRAHTPPGTRAMISVADGGDHAVIDVSDTGPGFPAAEIERVFERFYRADPSRSRRSGGSGLGLSIVEAIVVAHGGTVTASNAPHGGARVTVTLPRAIDS